MTKKFKVKVNKKSYEVEIEELEVVPVNHVDTSVGAKTKADKDEDVKSVSPPPVRRTNPGIKEVVAPLPGVIVDVLVKEKKSVKAGDKLLVLEAMKMENSILSPVDGKIEKVLVKKGDIVNGNQLIIILA